MKESDFLTTAAGSRDEEYVQLLNRYKKPLFRLILCMVRSPSDADDLFQQTAITMWDKFAEFESGTSFYAWASTIARYKVRDFIKSSTRRRAYFSDAVVEKLAAEQADVAADDARLVALSNCKKKLTQRDQSLLVACYSGRETIAEVAERTGRSAGSVYANLWRVRRSLYECIERAISREGYA